MSKICDTESVFRFQVAGVGPRTMTISVFTNGTPSGAARGPVVAFRGVMEKWTQHRGPLPLSEMATQFPGERLVLEAINRHLSDADITNIQEVPGAADGGMFCLHFMVEKFG